MFVFIFVCRLNESPILDNRMMNVGRPVRNSMFALLIEYVSEDI